MGGFYDDSRYGVEKILTSHIDNDISAAAVADELVVLHEAINIVEFGFIVTTAITAGGEITQVQIRTAASAVVATLSIPTGTAVNTRLRTTTGISQNIFGAGDTLLFQTELTNTGPGAGKMYIVYKERYV
jgi:hypothetical protein